MLELLFHERNFDLLPSQETPELEVEIDRFRLAESRELIKKLFCSLSLAHMLLNDKQFSISRCCRASRELFH